MRSSYDKGTEIGGEKQTKNRRDVSLNDKMKILTGVIKR
jgi:hypothetical protein